MLCCFLGRKLVCEDVQSGPSQAADAGPNRMESHGSSAIRVLSLDTCLVGCGKRDEKSDLVISYNIL